MKSLPEHFEDERETAEIRRQIAAQVVATIASYQEKSTHLNSETDPERIHRFELTADLAVKYADALIERLKR